MNRKRMRILWLAVIFMLTVAFAVGCGKDAKKYYTVTFIDGDTVYARVEVERGKRLQLPSEPTREDANYVFDGWYFDEDAQKIWDVDRERVTSDVILWSNFLYVSQKPGNISMEDRAFSGTLTWLQRGIDAETKFEIKLRKGMLVSDSDYFYEDGESVDSVEVSGKEGLTLEPYKNHDDIFTVKWTPSVMPKGGVYSAEIKYEDEVVAKAGLLFKGSGTESDPYLVTDATDLEAINSTDIEGGCYKLYRSFNAKLFSQKIYGKTFDGVLDGNGNTITVDAGGSGVFGTIGKNATVTDLKVAGSISDATESCTGIIACANKGRIEYCAVSAAIESSIGKVGTLEGDKDAIEGGAGGIVGVNYGVVDSCEFSGTAKAKVGAGGIAVINNGKITNCTYSGTLGAGNAIESGSSTVAMSYLGGIASVNYGEIQLCSATGRLLAQRSLSGGGVNNNVGGIVALNTDEGSIQRCFTNSQRIYGNRNVGGIAGENGGTISYCYVTASYRSNISTHNYIGGSANVGGIVGLTNEGGTVKNCYALANVYAYDGAAYKVAQSCENCAYVKGNLDERDFTVINSSGETKKTVAKSLTYPSGDNNIEVELTDQIKTEYKTKAYTLALEESQYSALNGKDGYYKSQSSLTFDRPSTAVDKSIKVTVVYDDDNKSDPVTVNSRSGNKFTPSAPDKEGSYVAGFTTAEGSKKIVFEYGDRIGYTDLQKYDADEIRLYPVYIDGERPENYVLKVAVWTRYVREDVVKALIDAYKTSEYYGEEYSVTFSALGSSNNANFKTDYETGDFNVAFGYAASAVDEWQKDRVQVYIYNVYASAYGNLKVGLNSNDGVVANFGLFLSTDAAKKIMCPEYVEVSLYSGEEKVGGDIVFSGKNLTLPTPEAEEDGMVFVGWATGEEPTEGETLYTKSVSYDTLVEASQNKALNLYARFEAGEPTDPDTILRVAVFNNSAFDRGIATELVEAFKAYCEKNDLECNIAEEDLLVGETKYADFTAAAIAGGYNIAIGFQANDFTTVHGIPADNIKDIRLSATSTRRIALLKSDALAVEFFGAFIESDAAKKIMNPAYISEAEADKVEITLMDGAEQYGEKLTVSNATDSEYAEIKLPVITPEEGMIFLGWATAAEAQEDEEYLSGTMDYAAALALATEGKLTLYARYKEGEKPQILKVAIWTRYVEEETVKALLEAYKTSAYYGEGYSVVSSALGSSNNGNFKTDYEAGDFNVAFGYAASAVDAWQDDRVEVYIYNVNTSAYGNLKVGLNGGDEIVTNFGLFLATDAAKKIMNPAYISEAEAEPIEITLYSGTTQYGEKLTVSNATEAENKEIALPKITELPDGYASFIGWAIGETAAEDETVYEGTMSYADIEKLATEGKLTLYARFGAEPEKVVIKVAVYKKFVDQPVVDALEAAFRKYCADNNIECDEFEFVLMTTGNGSAFTSDAADYDVAMGHKAGTSFAAKETVTVAMMMNAANGGTVANDRKAERLTDKEIAVKFMEFLQTDEGKAALVATAE